MHDGGVLPAALSMMAWVGAYICLCMAQRQGVLVLLAL
jgi:hypothetical protein